ncbi:MAG: YtxH domain-containing protein [Bacillota bacterium]|nr:YtxH domain-containing protein [Bacillota bacterium]
MRSHLAKGLIIGGIVGATVGAMVSPEMRNGRTRKRMMRTGRQFVKKSGNIIGDVVDLFR